MKCLAYLIVDGVIDGEPLPVVVTCDKYHYAIDRELNFTASRAGAFTIAFADAERGIFFEYPSTYNGPIWPGMNAKLEPK